MNWADTSIARRGLLTEGIVQARFLAAVLVLVGAFALQADARTLYVSPEGSDHASGSISEPLRTPAKAVEHASAGDTVFLRGGSYRVSEYITIDKPNLVFASYPGETAAIAGPMDKMGLVCIIIVVADGVTLNGLDIQGSAYYGVKVDVLNGRPSRGVIIRNCHIHDTGADCIKSFQSDGLLVEDCNIGPSGIRDSSDAEGIDSVASVGVTVRRCYIHDTATNGVYLKGGARDGLIEACRIENTHGFGGILLGQDTDLVYMRDGTKYEAINCVARNNIIVNTGAAGLGTYSGNNIRFENNTLCNVAQKGQAAFWIVTNSRNVPPEHITFLNNIVLMSSARPMVYVQNPVDKLTCDYNVYFGKSGNCDFVVEVTLGNQSYNKWNFGSWKRAMDVDRHSKTADPLINPANLYKPRPGSPALAAGLALPDVRQDYAGNNRTGAAAYDIGAYQLTTKTVAKL
ncbi:MAG TPA: right-handed parallel beta-helix repeat-containing protein [Blastocatellia bacterium]